jgi:hypothetical protein
MRAPLKLSAIVCVLLMLGGFGASAQDSKYPPEVESSLEFARKECKEAEGTGTTFTKNTVRKIDLTGDGRADYIVSMDEAKCEGRESYFCGTGGCGLEILVALPNGKYVSVFDARVRSYKILPGKGAKSGNKRIQFELHGGYCGRSGVPSCYKTRRITTKPFQFKEPG